MENDYYIRHGIFAEDLTYWDVYMRHIGQFLHPLVERWTLKLLEIEPLTASQNLAAACMVPVLFGLSVWINFAL